MVLPQYPLNQTKKDNLREQIFLGYHNCSEANNTGLVRSGEAFRLFESLYPDVSLYALDDINHPSLAGAFLSSCTFFGYFTGQRVSDTTYAPEGIDSDLAIKLKAVADQINFGS